MDDVDDVYGHGLTVDPLMADATLGSGKETASPIGDRASAADSTNVSNPHKKALEAERFGN